jgi:WD40 repeat protein
MKTLLFFVPAFVLAFSLFATPEKPNFQDDIVPVFEQSCNSCHNPDKAKGGLDLTGMNGILAGGSSGDVASPGDPDSSLIYLLAARLQEPHMPPRGEKIEKSNLLLIKNWIAQGMLPTASGKPMKKKKPSVNLALGSISIGKPDGPAPMPKHLPLQPAVVTQRAFAPSAMATAPWSAFVALAGQKQVLLYNTENLAISGILAYEEGFIESLTFSRNGKLIIASGGRGGKSGNVVGWNVETGRRVLTVGDEQDSVLTTDISADQSLVAIGGTSKLIKVFDLATNEILYKIKKHSEWVTQVAFSPDGILLATADRNGGLYVWEAKTGNPFYSLVGHKQEITSLSWRADGNVLLSASEEGAVRTWEMINGKQVKTWNAHSGGTLSAHFAQNGNMVTAGRDKSVKFWDGNGKALQTIKGFSDIVMEARLSHDGSKIIAGDWTGKVGIWNSTDGKSIGELNPNPPTLESRISLAKTKLVDDQNSLKKSLEKLAPFQEKIDEATRTIAANQKSLQATELALKKSIIDVQTAKSGLDQASADLSTKSNLQAEASKTYDAKKQELTNHQKNLESNTANYKEWNKLAKQRSEQLSAIKESYRKANEVQIQNQGDSSHAEAVVKAKKAMDAMEESYIHAANLSAKHKSEMEKYSARSNSLKTALTEAVRSLDGAKQAVTTSQTLKSKMEQSWKDALQSQTSVTTNRDQAKRILADSEKLLTQAKEKIKEPASEGIRAQEQVNSSEKNLSKWNAEKINFTRHKQITFLHELEEELSSFDEALEESKNIFTAAQKAVDNAAEALNSLPQKISEHQQNISRNKERVESEKRLLKLTDDAKNEKISFIQQVDKIQKLNQGKTKLEPQNNNLSQAGIKLAESITLLQQDLKKADEKFVAKQAQLIQASSDLDSAELALVEVMKLRESAPKVLQEKENALKEAKNTLLTKQSDFTNFKQKVDQQKSKTEDLFQQYLLLLPK